MIPSLPDDVQQMIAAQMATGGYASEADLLRAALAGLQAEQADDTVAVLEAIEQWQAGDDGIALDEAFEEVRRRYADFSSRAWRPPAGQHS